MRKLLSCLLILILLTSIFTACGQNPGEIGDQKTPEPTQAYEPGGPATDISSMAPEDVYEFDAAANKIIGFVLGISGIKEIEFPSEISGQPVKVIGDSAFREKGFEVVILPDTLEVIENSAFRHNNLTELVIPEGVTSIGMESFSQNKLTEVTLPESLLDIGIGAFRLNMLTGIDLPDGIEIIRRNTFLGNVLTELVLPSSVKLIESHAFFDNKLASLVLNDGLERIDGQSFKKNQLTELTIPASVKLIGEHTEGTTPQRNFEKYVFYANDISKVTFLGDDTEIKPFLMGENNHLRDAYYEGGAGTYTGTQQGSWEKTSGN